MNINKRIKMNGNETDKQITGSQKDETNNKNTSNKTAINLRQSRANQWETVKRKGGVFPFRDREPKVVITARRMKMTRFLSSGFVCLFLLTHTRTRKRSQAQTSQQVHSRPGVYSRHQTRMGARMDVCMQVFHQVADNSTLQSSSFAISFLYQLQRGIEKTASRWVEKRIQKLSNRIVHLFNPYLWKHQNNMIRSNLTFCY